MSKIILRRLRIKNVGLIADETVELNKPLICFYGEIRQGKTTLLNAVKWALGSPFPSDIIRHGQQEASATLEFEGGSVGRSWYRNEDGETTARPVQFIRNGVPVKRPMDEIRRFMNPFLLDQDHLRNMTEPERKAYFTELFALDTTDIDRELGNAVTRAQALRASIKAAGDIDATPVEKIDGAKIEAEMKRLSEEFHAVYSKALTEHRKSSDAVKAGNREAVEHNARYDSRKTERSNLNRRLEQLKRDVQSVENDISALDKWIDENPPKPLTAEPEAPDFNAEKGVLAKQLGDLQSKLSEAKASEVRYQQYQSSLQKLRTKQAEQKELDQIEDRQRELKKQKIAKLKSVSDSSGIVGLSFDESGEFTYDGTAAGMLSTSQLMKLSSELSALYPAGFGIELLDRGESLGKSIFGFIERAKKEEKTILASIVGEKPATIPDDVGVFVVENGKVKP